MEMFWFVLSMILGALAIGLGACVAVALFADKDWI